MLNPQFSLVAAMDQGRVIGQHGELPWKLPRDMKHFRLLTEGHVVVMGRKTFESIGKPLKKRRNIVLSKTLKSGDGFEVATSVDEVRQKCIGSHEVMVIGGAKVYDLFLTLSDRMYLTYVDTKIKGKGLVRFPKLSADEWLCVRSYPVEADEKNPFNMEFVEYLRKGRESS